MRRGRARRAVATCALLAGLTLGPGGCASTRITAAWSDPAYPGPPFRRILVVGVTPESAVRRVFEDEFVRALQGAGVEAVASYTLLPEDGPAALERLKDAVEHERADGVLVTRVVGVDRRTEYSPGYVTAAPGIAWSHSLYGYYGAAWAFYEPPVVREYEVVTLETNLWEARNPRDDGHLVWSVSTETFAPEDTRKETEELATILIRELRQRGLL
jgi:hypothetical protein